jgi:rRNA maturation endonuclease Nob1
MALLEKLKRLIETPSVGEEEENFRCIRCGKSFERDYQTCPECGGQFVVPLDDAEEP